MFHLLQLEFSKLCDSESEEPPDFKKESTLYQKNRWRNLNYWWLM